MEDAYIIKGGKKLKGEITLSGAKNASLKIIIAALMFENEVVLHNVPRINDVYELLHLVKTLGGKASFIEKNTVSVDGRSLKNNRVDLLHASKTRVSFMFFAPLLHKFHTCYIPNPGGCRIGARPIDRIVEGMRNLGVSVNYKSETGYYGAQMQKKPKGAHTFKKNTHTGTELLIMISIFAEDSVVIINAASEPEIDELIRFLNEAGANIRREKNKVIIQGVSRLKQKKPFTIMSDRNEAVTFATLVIASGGSLRLKNISIEHLKAFVEKIKLAGGGIEKIRENEVKFFFSGKIKPVDIVTASHPGFMTDWQPNWAILMTQAKGRSTIHERVFENRFSYVVELKKLGAHIKYITPSVSNPKEFYEFNYDNRKKYLQMIEIEGGHSLHGGVLSISDLRAGATLVMASLIAQGESVVTAVSTLERGYEDFIGKVADIGGEIRKV